MPHPAGFGQTHPSTYYASPGMCSKCHSSSFCSNCHGVSLPHSERFIGEPLPTRCSPTAASASSATATPTPAPAAATAASATAGQARRLTLARDGHAPSRAESTHDRVSHLHNVFVGVTGASGAPYAQRLLAALADAGCELALCVSDSGVLVLRHELELPDAGARRRSRALVERAGAAAVTRVYEPDDLAAPAASGSAAPDAVVVCPCSMSTAAHIALGTTRNLIHRVADVALKERRRLVVVPRETPLSSIHLRRLLELSEAGAAGRCRPMPGFYARAAELSSDAVDHVVGKTLAALGFEQRLFPPWDGGTALTRARWAAARRRDPRRAARRSRPRPHRGHVRPHRAALRPHEPADDRRSRPALAAAGGGRGRAAARRPRPRRLLRHRRPRLRARRALAGLSTSPASTSPTRCSSAPGRRCARRRAGACAQPARGARLRPGRPARAALRRRRVRRRHRRLGRAQRARPAAGAGRDGARDAPGRARRLSRVDAPARGPRPPLPRGVVRPPRARARAGSSPARAAPTPTCRPRCATSPTPTAWRSSWPRPASRHVRYRRSASAPSPCTSREVPADATA